MMELSAEQLNGKPKEVGVTSEGDKVFHIVTKGGFNLIVSSKKGKRFEVLGTAPHKAIAKHIAKRHADITWTELEKSVVDPATFQHLLPKYEAITELFCKYNNG